GDEEVAVLFVDLDDFKNVNDRLGHAVGDQLLVAAGERLRRCVRGGDLVARLGGDEFAMLLAQPDGGEAGAIDVAERVLKAVQYQPIIDLSTGATVAAEALVRWDHPGRGRIPPGEFIPLAEETGLIVPLGRFVLEEACARARTWATHGPGGAPLKLQVNLSAI